MNRIQCFLADRQAITDLALSLLPLGEDRLDIPLGYSIWHDDARSGYGADVYQGDGRGAIDHIARSIGTRSHHSHQVSNILIRSELAIVRGAKLT